MSRIKSKKQGVNNMLVFTNQDNNTGTTTFAGTITAAAGEIGAWNIDADSIYSGTKKVGDGYSAGAGSLTINSDGSIHAANFYINADGEVSFSATAPILDGIATKIVAIGTWNMDANDTATTPHALDYTKIRSVSVMIIADSDHTGDGDIYPIVFDNAISGNSGLWYITTTLIVIGRITGGYFDSTGFNDEGINRGYVTIQYEV